MQHPSTPAPAYAPADLADCVGGGDCLGVVRLQYGVALRLSGSGARASGLDKTAGRIVAVGGGPCDALGDWLAVAVQVARAFGEHPIEKEQDGTNHEVDDFIHQIETESEEGGCTDG